MYTSTRSSAHWKHHAAASLGTTHYDKPTHTRMNSITHRTFVTLGPKNLRTRDTERYKLETPARISSLAPARSQRWPLLGYYDYVHSNMMIIVWYNVLLGSIGNRPPRALMREARERREKWSWAKRNFSQGTRGLPQDPFTSLRLAFDCTLPSASS